MNSQALSSPIVNLLNDPFFMDLFIVLEEEEKQEPKIELPKPKSTSEFQKQVDEFFKSFEQKKNQNKVEDEWDWWFNTQTLEDYKEEQLTPVSDCMPVWNFVSQEYSARRIRVFY